MTNNKKATIRFQPTTKKNDHGKIYERKFENLVIAMFMDREWEKKKQNTENIVPNTEESISRY